MTAAPEPVRLDRLPMAEDRTAAYSFLRRAHWCRSWWRSRTGTRPGTRIRSAPADAQPDWASARSALARIASCTYQENPGAISS